MNRAQIPIGRPLWLILALMTAVACTPKAETSKSSKAPKKKAAKQESPGSDIGGLQDFFPEFRVESVDSELLFKSKITRKNGEQTFKTRIKLTGLATFDGQEYVKYEIENQGLPGSSKKTIYYRTGKDGIWKKESPEAKEVLEIPFPVKLNEGWSFNTKTVKNYGVATAFEDVEIDGQRYENCLKIEYQLTTIKGRLATRATQIEYRLRAAGMVKSVIRYQSGETFTLNLESGTISNGR